MDLSPVQKEELGKLVDKYEGRRDYALEEKSPRRTMLSLEKKKYPDYYHVSDGSFRLAFNRDMEDLAARGFVELEWVKFDRGYSLERVILQEDALPQIYTALKRQSRKEEYRQLARTFTCWQEKSPKILSTFYKEMLAKLYNFSDLPARVKLGNLNDYEDFLKGLHAFFTPRQQEVLKRQLSVNLFRDSKRWEELEKNILWAAKNYCLPSDEAEMEEGDILSEHNILETPRHINLAGPLTFTTPKGRVDVASFYPDLGLSPSMVQEMRVEECTAQAVVTVENLTSFYQYAYVMPTNHLVLYLGGYHNRPRRLILTKIGEFFKEAGRTVPFHHWGDMDLGGFRIWQHLCQRTGIPVKPLMMDEETYLAHISQGQPMQESYVKKLAELLENSSYTPVHALINLMLEKGIRVEQEAVAIKVPNAIS